MSDEVLCTNVNPRLTFMQTGEPVHGGLLEGGGVLLPLPALAVDPFDVLEIRIACHQCQPVLEGGCRDPDVVLRIRPALSAKLVLELAVPASGFRVTPQQGHRTP